MSDYAFTATELAAMQAHQAAHMMDTCTVDAWSAADNAYNLPNVTWTSGAAMACGYEVMQPDEAMATTTDAPVFDARLRLPIDAVVDPKDRITITKRHGVAVTPIVHEVVGDAERGPSGLVVKLRKVTD